MERNQRTTLQGTVVSIKMNKTIAVRVSTERNDPLYAKRIGYSKKYYAHDEKNEAKVGDVVLMMACRPISKLKRFRLVEIVKHAPQALKVAEAEAALETNEGARDVITTPELAEADKAEAVKDETEKKEEANHGSK